MDDNAHAEDGGPDQVNQDIVTEFWLRMDSAWQQNVVVCTHVGIHNLIIHDNALFWLSEDGCMCSVREDEDNLHLTEWEAAIETIGTSFSLLEDLGSLYNVTSGDILPNLATRSTTPFQRGGGNLRIPSTSNFVACMMRCDL